MTAEEKGKATKGAEKATSHTHNHHVSKDEAKKMVKTVVHDLLIMAGEFVGTFLFLWSAFMGAQSANVNNRGNSAASNNQAVTVQDNQTILFIALSFGMSLIVVAWACFRITGSAFNPVVSISLYLIGASSLRRTGMVVVAQMLGGIAAAGVAKGLSLGVFAVENGLAVGLRPRNGMAIEMLTTALLVFTVLMTAAEKNKSTFLAPVAIGLALFVGHLASVGWTGAGINPARTFGPSVVNANFPGYAWCYYVGQASLTHVCEITDTAQLLGGLIATLAYVGLKNVDYAEIVAGIDSEHQDLSADVKGAPVMAALSVIPGISGNDENSEEPVLPVVQAKDLQGSVIV